MPAQGALNSLFARQRQIKANAPPDLQCDQKVQSNALEGITPPNLTFQSVNNVFFVNFIAL